jgi:hypothetical protein
MQRGRAVVLFVRLATHDSFVTMASPSNRRSVRTMFKTMTTIAMLALAASGCDKQNEPRMQAQRGTTSPLVPATTVEAAEGFALKAPVPQAAKKLFLDVHDLGSGKVSARAAAEAHAKDLATQGKYGVDFKAYWVDEKQGKIYCLVEAPSADAASNVHREAHGLVADEIMEVKADVANWAPTPGMKLFIDVHRFGPGKVTAKDVAGAHAKDVAVGPKHGVKYLNYWLEESTGTVTCLSEAPNADAALAVHQEAHGLMPESIEEVSEGR